MSIPIRLSIILLLMIRSYLRKSLTTSGIVAAVITGVIHSVTASSINLVLLVGFFITGTLFTKVKSNVKKSLTVHVNVDEAVVKSNDNAGEFHESRNHVQVLANSIVASVLIAIQLFLDYNLIASIDSIKLSKTLQVGIIAQYAAVTSDTWSSELGILSASPPRLITTLKPCPKGTNGGVSELGLRVALLGGLFIGLISSFFSPSPLVSSSWDFSSRLQFTSFIGLVGLFGSVLDSVLGALLQKSFVNRQGKIIEVDGGYRFNPTTSDEIKPYSGLDILSNNQVNLIMAVSTSLLTMLTYWLLY